MSVNALITDGSGTGQQAFVTKFGQLVTSSIDFSSPIVDTLDTPGSVVNFIGPQSDRQIVITTMIIQASKDVSPSTPATVAIFGSTTGDDSSVISESILTQEMLREDRLVLTGLNLITNEGTWINATTTDDDILMTIMFYRVPLQLQ